MDKKLHELLNILENKGGLDNAFCFKVCIFLNFWDIKWTLQEEIISGFPANKTLSLTKKVLVY